MSEWKRALQEQLAAIEGAAGCWSDEDYPELQTDEDIDRWLRELRASWEARLDVTRVRVDKEGP